MHERKTRSGRRSRKGHPHQPIPGSAGLTQRPKGHPASLPASIFGTFALAVTLAVVLVAAAIFFLSAGLPTGLSAGPSTGPAISPSPTPPTPPPQPPPASSQAADRKTVSRLIDEQKFEEAAKQVAAIRDAAKLKNDGAAWAWALIKEAQLRTALHGYETAVRFLKDEAWPAGPVDRDMLDLFYAQSLVTYYEAYSWEVDRRERVEARGPVDLKSWTKDQIYAESWSALMRVWKDRERLADLRTRNYPDFWQAGDYPAGIRDTLRDAVVYLIARLLSNTSFWTPRQSNETYLLDLEKLLAPPPAALSADAILDSPAAHPLEKAAALLGEHATWCRRPAGRPEGELEARLVLFDTLHEAFAQDIDRALIRKRLAEMLPAFRRYPWWATGMAVLAEFTREESAPDALVRARALALQGAGDFPASPGGKRCLAVVKGIEAPAYSFESMSTDRPGRRSIRITHRNLGQVYLRAYPTDLEERIRTSHDYNLLPQYEEVGKVLDGGKPAAAWAAELPMTPDYRDHHTYVDLPAGLGPGLYVVACSALKDFPHRENQIIARDVLVSELVLLKRIGNRGGQEAILVSGATGRPVAGASVDLYLYDWQKGHSRVETQASGADGRAFFAGRQRTGPYFLVAKKGRDLAFDAEFLYLYGRTEPADASRSLIYTDRSIYRPGQKLYWKVVAYRGRRDLGQLKPAAGSPVSVWLEDPNGQRVAEGTAAANAFGTASGEFVIPAAGRPLGPWRLRSSPDGFAGVRVEEYKRPTFEVAVKDPAKPLRLNRPAALVAEARYYFGLPVASGTAVWQVRREPVYPRWWWWERGGGGSQVVGGGKGQVREDGTIEVAFTPRADEREGAESAGVTYRYTLTVDVTDEGGETRSTTRTFRLGTTSIEATLAAESGFGRAGAATAFSIIRADLNGTPKSGTGTWRVVRLVQPAETLLPADQPVTEPPANGPEPYRTPGDRLRPRWEAAPSTEEILRSWKDGPEKASGKTEHDAGGRAAVGVSGLEPGAYRILYETKDEFGAACREQLDFLVAGTKAEARLPVLARAEQSTVPVGKTARLLVHSGFAGQPLLLETFKGGALWESRWVEAGKETGVLEIPVTEELRGGFGARLTAVRDHQLMTEAADIFVPWDSKQLDLSFSTFRDKLAPGAKETWRVTVRTPEGKPAVQGAAELLAYMYDRSLDLFAPHTPPSLLGLYPSRVGTVSWDSTLGPARECFSESSGWAVVPSFPVFREDVLAEMSGYGIGGPGGRRYGPAGRVMAERAAVPAAAQAKEAKGGKDEAGVVGGVLGGVVGEVEAPTERDKESRRAQQAAGGAAAPLRSNFSETAFWQPHLLTGADGTAAIEFTVPDSVTGWRVFVHGVTRDLAGGSLEKEARTVKELMVRPYLPRFFREGDRAELRVMVNNAGETVLSGEVALEVFDPATNENLAPAFGLPAKVPARPFTVKPGGGQAVTFPLAAPARVGTVAFKVTAKAGAFGDGELRPLPVLPGRMHLVQSRFATLKGDGARRELKFADLVKTDDPSRINEQLIVTVDGQLFYGLLEALPYLVNYPYECTEQTLNRFLSTGILTSLYDKYPSVAAMAKELSKRNTVYETFDAADPNRKMGLEETPWLNEARGGTDAGYGVEKVLDPRVAAAQRDGSLAKLLKAQTSLGAFPWWPGGPPSPYMTLYIVHGFSKALEFGAAVPKDPVVRAFGYLHRHYLDEIVSMLMAHDTGWEFVTFLNYTLSNFPDASWTGGVFTEAERTRMLDFSFKHWKEHSPYLKGYLALTLKRAARGKDAALVWDSVMDSAKTTADEGTSWAPEDRGWLWYNDTIETHAFALRTLMELRPADARSEGLVQWLFLNKKLNHWKSTRATAEVIYSVAYFLKRTGALGVREAVTAEACGVRTTFTFEPDRYTGKKNQVVVPGGKLGPQCAAVRVTKEGKGMAFASATWHFSTEKMPDKGEGDLFAVERSYFKREKRGEEVVLRPLAEGAALAVGDEIEVQLSIRARHPAEYVHLRDPRPAGCEPVTLVSGYKWDLGLVRYEEIRDSGTNFFMEWVPQGEYTLKHRMRCTMAGTFKAAPATLQSMYAPEFAAYSAGALVTIK